jgi:arginine deiminase
MLRRNTIWLLLALVFLLSSVSAWAKGGNQKFSVNREHQKLHTVMVHEPGKALARINSRNVKRMLFEEPVTDVGKARAEHQHFQDILRSRGVQVLKVHDLLRDVLDQPQARMALVNQAIAGNRRLDATRKLELGKLLASLPSHELASLLTEGLTQNEVGKLSRSSIWKSAPEELLTPLANLMFTRDSTKVVGNSFSVSKMATALRNHESRLLKFIVQHHPRFAGIHMLEDHGEGFAAIEGGDMLVIDPKVNLVGVGERTKPAAVLAWAKELFRRKQAETVIMTDLPNKGSMFHTDTIMNRVSEDHMLIHPVVDHLGKPLIITPGRNGGVQTRRSGRGLIDTLSEVTGRERSFKRIAVNDERTADIEQELDGPNVLPIANGVVIGYQHNRANNAALEKAGIEVLQFDGEQLVKGRGGPHCLSRPFR